MSSNSDAITRTARALQNLRPDFTLTNAKTFARALASAPEGVFGEKPLAYLPAQSDTPKLSEHVTSKEYKPTRYSSRKSPKFIEFDYDTVTVQEAMMNSPLCNGTIKLDDVRPDEVNKLPTLAVKSLEEARDLSSRKRLVKGINVNGKVYPFYLSGYENYLLFQPSRRKPDANKNKRAMWSYVEQCRINGHATFIAAEDINAALYQDKPNVVTVAAGDPDNYNAVIRLVHSIFKYRRSTAKHRRVSMGNTWNAWSPILLVVEGYKMKHYMDDTYELVSEIIKFGADYRVFCVSDFYDSGYVDEYTTSFHFDRDSICRDINGINPVADKFDTAPFSWANNSSTCCEEFISLDIGLQYYPLLWFHFPTPLDEFYPSPIIISDERYEQFRREVDSSVANLYPTLEFERSKFKLVGTDTYIAVDILAYEEVMPYLSSVMD